MQLLEAATSVMRAAVQRLAQAKASQFATLNVNDLQVKNIISQQITIIFDFHFNKMCLVFRFFCGVKVSVKMQMLEQILFELSDALGKCLFP